MNEPSRAVDAPSDRESATHVAVLGLTLLGAVLRIRPYLADRSLWLDEASLSLDIVGSTFRELLHPLALAQSAPLLFLWTEKLATVVLGVNEAALRLLPLLCGLALIPALYSAARRILEPWGALFATGFAAVSALLVRYSNEVKPYAGDALATTLLLLLALDLVEQPRPRAFRLLFLAGLAALLLSYPAVFVLGGVGLALVLSPGVREAPGGRAWLVTLALSWGGLFGLTYFLLYRGAAANDYLQRFWAFRFLGPMNPQLGAQARFALNEVLIALTLGQPRIPPIPVVLVTSALLVLGAVAVYRRKGAPVLMALAGPLALCLLASSAGRYPIAARLMVFAAPILILLVAAGLEQLGALLPRRIGLPLFAIGAAAALVVAAGDAVGRALHPPLWEHARPIVAAFEERRTAEPIYVFARAAPAWFFYTTDWTAPDRVRLDWFTRIGSPGGPAFENARSRGRAVRNEGGELVYPYRGRRELVGIATGMESRHGAGMLQSEPDAGWAENEVARLRAEARPHAWVFFSQGRDVAVDRFLMALRAAGARPVDSVEAARGGLIRIRFDPPPG